MKEYEKVEIPASIKDVCSATVCDLCGDSGAGSWPWQENPYDLFEARVRMQKGEGYDDCGSTVESIEYDICPKCFEEKLIPWLKSQGAKREWEESDW